MGEKLRNFVKKYAHPNRISALGTAIFATGIACLYHPMTQYLAPPLVALGYSTDFIDGFLARKYDLKTKEGAKLDPLADKVKNVVAGISIIANSSARGDYITPMTVAGNFVVDYNSQRQRGEIIPQLNEAKDAILYPENCTPDNDEKSDSRANWWGKTKTGLQTAVGLAYITASAYQEPLQRAIEDNYDTFEQYINYGIPIALTAAAASGIIGVHKRKQQTKNLEQITTA